MGDGPDTFWNRSLSRGELRNMLHSLLIVGGMALLLAAVGWTLGGVDGVLLLLGLGAFLFILNPTVSGSLILRLQGAILLPTYAAPGLVQMVDALAQRAELPVRPRIYRVPLPAMTAFAVGSREDPAIGITDGLLRGLEPRELAGVLAHEISHIQGNDIRVLGLAALMARATNLMSFLGQILLFLNLPLLLMGRVMIPWSAILLLVLAPTLSGLLQLALSRTREYDADLGAVRLTGDPLGLASALRRLEGQSRGLLGRVLTPGTEIPVPPFLRTHPRTEERIQRLLELEKERRAAESRAAKPPAVHLDQSGSQTGENSRWIVQPSRDLGRGGPGAGERTGGSHRYGHPGGWFGRRAS